MNRPKSRGFGAKIGASGGPGFQEAPDEVTSVTASRLRDQDREAEQNLLCREIAVTEPKNRKRNESPPAAGPDLREVEQLVREGHVVVPRRVKSH